MWGVKNTNCFTELASAFPGRLLRRTATMEGSGHLVLAEALAPRHREDTCGGRAVPTVGVRDHLRAGDNGRPDPYRTLTLPLPSQRTA